MLRWRKGVGNGLQMEVVPLRRFNHPPMVPNLICSGRTTRCLYLIMALLGPSLGQLFRICHKNASISTIVRVAIQGVDALKQIHQIGFIHRHFKSVSLSNSMLWKCTDFRQMHQLKMTKFVSIFLILSVFATYCSGIRFHLKPNEKRCLKEEIHKNVVVTGEYTLTEAFGYTASVHVTDTRGHTLSKRENFVESNGKFAFTADEYDIFEICIYSHVPENTPNKQDREVFLSMKHGVEAKNYDDLAKAEKLKPLEVELRRLEDIAESVVQDFAFMRSKEEEMRNTNESTNSRVLYLSIFSMLCLIGLSFWQVLYLRRFFKTKKLID
uniref:GOLD domain-containing protein n=1 Tax=Rhabditophanes sp. KR3021 TaxID=114890 RepID=A0AC35U1M8_9BILA